MRKIEEIPKEELQDDATFIAAVASAIKKSKEEQLGITDCPCGGKIKFWYSNYKGHKTVHFCCGSNSTSKKKRWHRRSPMPAQRRKINLSMSSSACLQRKGGHAVVKWRCQPEELF